MNFQELKNYLEENLDTIGFFQNPNQEKRYSVPEDFEGSEEDIESIFSEIGEYELVYESECIYNHDYRCSWDTEYVIHFKKHNLYLGITITTIESDGPTDDNYIYEVEPVVVQKTIYKRKGK